MPKFLFVYYGGMAAPTPAQQKKSMDAWMAWFKGMGKAVVDMGAPTKPGKMVSKAGARAAGAANLVTGYSVIKADNLDAAVAMAKSCPIMGEGGKIAVCETIPM